MVQSFARRILFSLAVATVLAPTSIALAQSSTPPPPPPKPPIITGGDPQPTGSAVPSITDLILLLPTLASL